MNTQHPAATGELATKNTKPRRAFGDPPRYSLPRNGAWSGYPVRECDDLAVSPVKLGGRK